MDAMHETVKEAVQNRQVLRIWYQPQDSKKLTERDIEVYVFSKTHFMGFCRIRKDTRMFRFDRTLDMILLQNTFKPTPFWAEFYERFGLPEPLGHITREEALLAQGDGLGGTDHRHAG